MTDEMTRRPRLESSAIAELSARILPSSDRQIVAANERHRL